MQSTVGAPSGLLQRLASDHAEVVGSMQQVAATIEVRVRQDLFPGIRRALLARTRAEEEAVYRVLAEHPGLDEVVARCVDEHGHVVRLLNRLDIKDKATKQWGDLFEELLRAVHGHGEREESELFPRAGAVLDRERAMRMERHYAKVLEQEL